MSSTAKKIGAGITHHFHKHRKVIANHVIKHHKKYIWGLGAISGVAIFKIVVVILGIMAGVTPQEVYGAPTAYDTSILQQNK